VVEIVRCERPFKTRITQRFDLVCELGIRISVNDRNLVPLGVSIQSIIRVVL
jgi:hypothetical protein